MFEKWDKELREKIAKDKSLKDDILGEVLQATLDTFAHSMQVEGRLLEKVYLDLQDGERADLEDYFLIEKVYSGRY